MATELNDGRDILVVISYFVLVPTFGIVFACLKARGTVSEYFLAGRNLTWLPIGLSLFASSIGGGEILGLAASGARSGIADIAFEWGAVVLLLVLGWVFLPVYLTSGVVTTPEYLQRRFGGSRLRLYFSVLSIIMYALTKISVEVYAGSIFIQYVVGWNTYYCLLAVLFVAAIYTVIGGLVTVIYTDILHTVILLGGAIYIAVLAFAQVGGLWALYYKYEKAFPSNYDSTLNNTECGLPRDDAFHIIRDPANSDLPWPGVIIKSTLASVWYWCADQVIVQKTLASRNIAHARGAVITAGYLKILPLFLILFPGMISRVLYPDEVACMDEVTCARVCGNPDGCSNMAYPRLILGLAPAGVRGLMIAVMMSAMVTSLTSVFNSAAALFTLDVWTRIRKEASEKELVICGRLTVVALVGISIVWIPAINAVQGPQLFLYIQTVTSYITPPVCVIFLHAVLVPRINEKGAFWGLLIGQVCGIVRLVVEIIFPAPACRETDNRNVVLSKVNLTYIPAMLMAISVCVVVGISLCTERPTANLIRGNTFWSVRSMERKRRDDERKRRPLKIRIAVVGREKYTDIDLCRSDDTASFTPESHHIRKEDYGKRYPSDTSSKADERMARATNGDCIKKDIRNAYQQIQIPSKLCNWIVNINAVCLTCVIILMYAMFS